MRGKKGNSIDEIMLLNIWNGGDKMSTPSTPYYNKEGKDTYHWETSCSRNHYPALGWNKTIAKPSKEQCNE